MYSKVNGANFLRSNDSYAYTHCHYRPPYSGPQFLQMHTDFQSRHTFAKRLQKLVHGQVTIIFVVSVCLFVCLSVCLCRVFLSRV